MNEELRQRIELLESLFQHPGWKLYQSDLQGFLDAIQEQWRHVPDARCLHIAQGRFDGLSQARNFDQFIESLKSQALEDSDVAT